MTTKPRAYAESETPLFTGFTKADGTKTHDAPSHWPFGTVGPITEYGFRYAPDTATHEKPEKEKKAVKKVASIEVFEEERFLPRTSDMTFVYMARMLTKD